MGQYWKPVNLTKKEYIDPHRLACGLKLWEQVAGGMTGRALLVLLATMPEPRGGGDLQKDPIIGHWAGDQVTLVGDYSEDSDFPNSPIPFSEVYDACDGDALVPFKDITDDVRRVLERELDGRFTNANKWGDFVPNP